jgi:hypothetical protein
LSPRAALLMGLCATGCLPGDDRPEPGTVLLMAEASEATTDGFTTEDGWTVALRHFLTALGDVDLDSYPDRGSGTCTEYNDTN